ncbi:MAG TPA: O-antigen ligase family protein [Thermoanaerobaculia bacterium]|nr:O-antigen ligase family protein [Thermoanaerobaculia bacterium]
MATPHRELTAPAADDSADERWRRLGYWGYGLHLCTIFGIALSNLFLGLTFLVTPRAVRSRPVASRTLEPIFLPLSLYVFGLAVSIALSYEPRVSVASLSELMSLGTLYLAPYLVRGEREVRRLVDALTLVIAAVALYGLAQFFFGYGDIERRIRGPFSHYMTFAGVLLVVDLLLLARMICGQGARRPWRWAALAAINLALLGSLTRNAWVGLGLTLPVLLFLRRPRWLAGLLPAALLFVVLAPVPLLHRVWSIGNLGDASNYDRLCMLDAGIHMIAERPLFGLGPDEVQRRYGVYRHPTAPRYWVPHLHNSLLQLTAESGLVTLAAYCWMMAASIGLAIRRYRAEGGLAGPRADLWLGAVLALVAFNLAGLFENNWGDTEVQRLALFALALPFCLAAGDAGAEMPPSA